MNCLSVFDHFWGLALKGLIVFLALGAEAQLAGRGRSPLPFSKYSNLKEVS